MVFLQVFAVGTRAHIVAVHPRVGYQFDQVLVALVVLGQHDEVVAALVLLAAAKRLRAVARHIHLAAEDGLEGLQSFLLAAFVHVVHNVVELLDAEHVSVVGDGHAAHAVADGFVHEVLDFRLSVEYRIVRMYVQMNEIFHFVSFGASKLRRKVEIAKRIEQKICQLIKKHYLCTENTILTATYSIPCHGKENKETEKDTYPP